MALYMHAAFSIWRGYCMSDWKVLYPPSYICWWPRWILIMKNVTKLLRKPKHVFHIR